MPHRPIESVLFDTSFLLNDLPDVDKIIKILHRGRVSCYISRTIQSEMDDLQDGDGLIDLGEVYGQWCGWYEGILSIEV